MDYAIIEMGGKQYRVEKGGSLLVDRVDAAEGARLTPKAVLYRSDKAAVLDGPELDKVKVEAVVAEHLRGPKVRVFKYRPKKRYRRRAGHRAELTRLEISDIKGPTARSREPAATKKEATGKAAGKAAGKPAGRPAGKTVAAGAEKKSPARKAPARKSSKES
jgi:large subunit ribosomal protein L21